MKGDKSRLVTLDMSPTEAAILVGLLEGVKLLRGEVLDPPTTRFLDGACAHVRLQLTRMAWPPDQGLAPFPV